MTPNQALAGSYDPGVVALSLLIAVVTSYAALELAGRMTPPRNLARMLWLNCGAVALGIGIWSMHFTGMLALRLPVPVAYHWPTLLVSLVLSMCASALALSVVSRGTMHVRRLLTVSLCMGLTIAGLHYTAMASMRRSGTCHYDRALATLSVVFAVGFSLLLLKQSSTFRDEPRSRIIRKAGSALLMGAAICIMHYTAMAGASFTSSDAVPDMSQAVIISSLGAGLIAMATLTVLGAAVAICVVDRIEEQRALLDQLFEQSPEGVALLNPNLEVVYVNREFTRIFGYTSEETVGRRLKALIVPEESIEESERRLHSVMLGQRIKREDIRVNKDGTRLNVFIVIVPVSVHRGKIAAYVMYQDITERKRAEEAERASEARWQSVFENSRVGIGLADREGFLLVTNKVFQNMVGYTGEELRKLRYRDITYVDDLERNGQLRQELWEGKRQQFQIEKRYVRKDGELIWVRNTISLVPGTEAIPQFGIAIVEDITERKRAEAELQDSLAQLRALAARLQKAREEERTRVAREIHDELGQSLTALRIELASLIHDLSPSHIRHFKATSLLKLVDQTIQSVRRISTDLRPGILDDLGLVAAIEWAAEEFSARTRIQFRMELPEEDIVVDQERATAIFRIFQETLTNIARHAAATRVEVRLGIGGGDVWLEIRDNGCGVSPEELSTGRSLGILGMRERAALLGGEWTISGSHGEGTTVKVWIPKGPPVEEIRK